MIKPESEFLDIQSLAERGDAEAQFKLGGAYFSGQYCPQDLSEAARWIRLSAEQGFSAAQFNLGYSYAEGHGLPQNQNEAMHWYRLAADQGMVEAQNNLAAMFEKQRNFTEAAKFYRQAAEQGYVPAQASLGYAYSKGRGVPRDYGQAIKWYSQAAEHYSKSAGYNLAHLYALQKVQLADPVIDYLWTALAAVLDNSVAQNIPGRFAHLIDTEIGGLITKATTGNAESQRVLSIRLRNGEGILSDKTASAIWLRIAANSGDSWAQTTLAIELRKTKNADNEHESVLWLLRAVAQGNNNARSALGLQQILGIGTAIDYEEGTVNLMMASLAGIEDAKGALGKYIGEMSKKQLATVVEKVQWPSLTFVMGPLAPGHLDDIRASQEEDDGSEGAPWLEYERESARILFLEPKSGGSLLDAPFGATVSITDIYVGRAIVQGQTVAAVTINLRNVVQDNGLPVWWRPSEEGLKAVTALIGVLDGRSWVQHSYLYF